MVNSFKRTDVATVKDDFAFELIPVPLDMIVLHKDNHHIHIAEELVEARVLVLYNLVPFKEWVVAAERDRKSVV